MKSSWRTWQVVFFAFSLTLSGMTFGADFPPLQFEMGDSLETIRDKIELNDYHFSVKTNWVFNLSPEDRQRLLGRHPSASSILSKASVDIGPLAKVLGTTSLPERFCWTNVNGHAYIGPIRDQGYCGSCYSFGACAAAEGTFNAKVGFSDSNCVNFSESFILWNLGRLPEYSDHFGGCSGADYDYMELAALTNEGLCAEAEFPYTIDDPGSITNWTASRTVFSSWHRIPCGDIEAIKTAIYTYGVVDAAIYVDSGFEAYSSGIYENSQTNCSESPCYYEPSNHAIALVGWDDNGGDGYWILRNSWGTEWGENGYMRVKYRTGGLTCAACYLVFDGTGAPPIAPVGLEASSGVFTNSVRLNWSCAP